MVVTVHQTAAARLEKYRMMNTTVQAGVGARPYQSINFLPVTMRLPKHKCPTNQSIYETVPMCLPEHKWPSNQSIYETVCTGTYVST